MTTTEPIISKELNDKIEEFGNLYLEVAAKDGIGDWDRDRKRFEHLLASFAGLINRAKIGDEVSDHIRMLRNQVTDGCTRVFRDIVSTLDNMVVMSMVKKDGIGKTVRRLAPTRGES